MKRLFKGRQWQAHCFGDSLTQGMSTYLPTTVSGNAEDASSDDFPPYPYSERLESLTQGKVYTTDNHGISGETSREVLRRFKYFQQEGTSSSSSSSSSSASSAVSSSSASSHSSAASPSISNVGEETLPAGELFIFLCGTNDIGTGLPAEEITENLRQMVAMTLPADSVGGGDRKDALRVVVLVTIPPLGFAAESQYPFLKQVRTRTNAAIRLLAKEFNSTLKAKRTRRKQESQQHRSYDGSSTQANEGGYRRVFVFDLHSVVGQNHPLLQGEASGKDECSTGDLDDEDGDGQRCQQQRYCYALKEEYNADGIHFTKKGYEVFAAELAQFLVKKVLVAFDPDSAQQCSEQKD